jgi:FHA domain/Double zinc ribbon
MIACPNCKHDNPEGATNCEACYTTLPATKACPNCGASIQLDATFCGQCGHNLKSTGDPKSPTASPSPAPVVVNIAPSGLPPTVLTSPTANIVVPVSEPVAPVVITPPVVVTPPAIVPVVAEPQLISQPIVPAEVNLPVAIEPVLVEPTPVVLVEPVTPVVSTPTTTPPVSTQLQQPARQLMHLQSNTVLEVPAHLQVIHLGKPNDLTPPDIDVSVFAAAEVVSRIHANIRIDGANYYIEDLGSANGTYINHNALAKGNRHLLRDGDRISLGKGDLVTFIFQAAT